MSFMLGTGLQGNLLGLVGYGAIGQAVARRAAAFGMRVAYTTRHEVPGGGDAGAVRLPLAELLATSDVVSLHCPLTPETRHLIDRRRAAVDAAGRVPGERVPRPGRRRGGAGRGAGEGWIRGAALDVFEREPHVHPGVAGSDAVLMTPHLGSATIEAREAMAVLAARNVAEVVQGRPPVTPVP